MERYFLALGLEPEVAVSVPSRGPFDSAMCDLVAELRPNVVGRLSGRS